MSKIDPYLRLLRLDKPIGTVLLLWPTLWAVWIAGNGAPSTALVTIFIAGVLVMRAAGCVINDFADRDIDGDVARTKARPMATGEITSKQALVTFSVLLAVAAVIAWQLNSASLLLAGVGAVMAIIYPFSKRFFVMPQLLLGLTWSIGLLMAFTAQNQGLPASAWLLYVAHVFLTIAYDTTYAMSDRPDDLQLGIYSSAILFADYDRIAIASCQLIFLGLMTAVGLLQAFNAIYFFGLVLAAAHFIYQHTQISTRDRQACLLMFKSNHYIGLIIFLSIVASYAVF